MKIIYLVVLFCILISYSCCNNNDKIRADKNLQGTSLDSISIIVIGSVIDSEYEKQKIECIYYYKNIVDTCQFFGVYNRSIGILSEFKLEYNKDITFKLIMNDTIETSWVVVPKGSNNVIFNFSSFCTTHNYLVGFNSEEIYFD